MEKETTGISLPSSIDQQEARTVFLQPDCFIGLFNHHNRPMHKHNCIELAYVLEGTAKHIMFTEKKGEETEIIKAGNYFFLDYSVTHGFQDESLDFEIMNILFFPSFIHHTLSNTQSFEDVINNKTIDFHYSMLTCSPVNHTYYDETRQIRGLFDSAFVTYTRNLPGARKLLRSYVVLILILSMQKILDLSQEKQSLQKDDLIAKISDYIENHYEEHTTLAEICNKHYFNTSYIGKKFKSVYGVSFEQYRQQIRVRKACTLLLETTQSVDSVAYQVGYTDIKAFRTVFTKLIGESPAQFRSKFFKNTDSKGTILKMKQQDMKGIIFDLDGVLLSTDHYHYLAWKQLADELNIPFNEKDNEQLRGVSRMESLEIILKKAENKTFTGEEKYRFAQQKNDRYREFLQQLTPNDIHPVIRETLLTLRKRNYLLAVGSSSKNAKFILERTNLMKEFDAVVDGNEISNSKPDPEVFLKAAERLNLAPQKCAVVEDAEAGLLAAISGGFFAIGFAGMIHSPLAEIPLYDFSDLLNIFS
ncbi:MAG: beta-phosphoglucomutase [Clostridia bacterium]|nr:beta-phosphoglucomutase [Clostridia bacterium]